MFMPCPPGRQVDMRGIAGQEHPPYPEALGLTRCVGEV
jgi:hypothetical protein